MSLLRSAFLFLLLVVIGLFPAIAVSHDEGGGDGGGSFYQKHKRRQAQRFDLISYLSDQKRIRAEQDAKWGYVKRGLPFEPDLALTYFKLTGDAERSGKLGDVADEGGRAQFFMNGLFSDSNKRRLVNIDVGFEAFYRVHKFTVAGGSTQTDWGVSEAGGALLLRPFGRSSQDTGLFFKAGYSNLEGKGLWSTSVASRSLAAGYWGGEAKLYLLPILGARAEYTSTFAKEEPALGGTWSQTRMTYGAFLELFVISVEAQIFETRYQLKPTGGGAESLDTHKGLGLLGTFYF